LIGVSRPFLVGELESGKIPFHRAGTHRRIYYKDLTAYKNEREQSRNTALDELAKQAQDLDLGY
jgi:excisionase family DNA binding protein